MPRASSWLRRQHSRASQWRRRSSCLGCRLCSTAPQQAQPTSRDVCRTTGRGVARSPPCAARRCRAPWGRAGSAWSTSAVSRFGLTWLEASLRCSSKEDCAPARSSTRAVSLCPTNLARRAHCSSPVSTAYATWSSNGSQQDGGMARQAPLCLPPSFTIGAHQVALTRRRPSRGAGAGSRRHMVPCSSPMPMTLTWHCCAWQRHHQLPTVCGSTDGTLAPRRRSTVRPSTTRAATCRSWRSPSRRPSPHSSAPAAVLRTASVSSPRSVAGASPSGSCTAMTSAPRRTARVVPHCSMTTGSLLAKCTAVSQHAPIPGTIFLASCPVRTTTASDTNSPCAPQCCGHTSTRSPTAR
mmetsp:Transcript_12496/g.36081  ORF Transcript_12496/g.36081 Transcript_12496/m.36081 type:complete len:353 (+) Transcript_12496:517-1575(+)